jgi:hypothetical protein
MLKAKIVNNMVGINFFTRSSSSILSPLGLAEGGSEQDAGYACAYGSFGHGDIYGAKDTVSEGDGKTISAINNDRLQEIFAHNSG